MCRMNGSLDSKRILYRSAHIIICSWGTGNGTSRKGPTPPPCTNAHCWKIRSFLKAHYCGESPYGNGPDDGCLINPPQKPGTGIDVLADSNCEWSESKQAAQCEQCGQLSSLVRSILIRKLRRLGLPAEANGQTYFTVWESPSSRWSLAKASYSRTVGLDIELCQVIVIIDQTSHVLVLRKLPFQKTNVDVPTVTQWFPVDLADADGEGQLFWREMLTSATGSTLSACIMEPPKPSFLDLATACRGRPLEMDGRQQQRIGRLHQLG